MAKETVTEEKQDGAARPAGGEANGDVADFAEANEALHGLRSAIDQASRSLRELSRTGEQWAKDAEGRALEIGKELRGHGGRAVGGVARQVEQNPLTSLAIAFALGFLCAAVARR
jgi:ElaB/YqjD/DUF883 family membrane-anchored ribosome-binding protein